MHVRGIFFCYFLCMLRVCARFDSSAMLTCIEYCFKYEKIAIVYFGCTPNFKHYPFGIVVCFMLCFFSFASTHAPVYDIIATAIVRNHRHQHKQQHTNITVSAAAVAKLTVSKMIAILFGELILPVNSSSGGSNSSDRVTIAAKCKHTFYLRSVLTKE